MHKGKWKHKVPPRALAVTSTYFRLAIHDISVVREIYSTCSSGKNNRVTRQRAWRKYEELGSDNSIYQSHFPYLSLSFFNQVKGPF